MDDKPQKTKKLLYAFQTAKEFTFVSEVDWHGF